MHLILRNTRLARMLCLFCLILISLTLRGRTQSLPLSGPPPGKASEGAVESGLPGPHFVAHLNKTPVGTSYSVDFVNAAGNQSKVLNVLTGTNALSLKERANIIASRLQTLFNEHGFRGEKLQVGKVDHQVVVMESDSGRFIITADGVSSRRAGMDREQYAVSLLKQMRFGLLGQLR